MSDTSDGGQKREVVEWSYDDPASCAAAWEAAMNDPEFIAEAMQVYRDFEFTMADGLNGDDMIGYFDE